MKTWVFWGFFSFCDQHFSITAYDIYLGENYILDTTHLSFKYFFLICHKNGWKIDFGYPTFHSQFLSYNKWISENVKPFLFIFFQKKNWKKTSQKLEITELKSEINMWKKKQKSRMYAYISNLKKYKPFKHLVIKCLDIASSSSSTLPFWSPVLYVSY